MFEKVLIGLDHRQGGLDAISLARQLAPQGDLMLAHVYAIAVPGTRGGAMMVDSELDRAQQLLRKRREETSVDAELEVCGAATVSSGLHELAKDRDADLIVIGSSHRGPLGRILNGDDARATLHGAPCPVAIAPGGYAKRATAITQIGFGFDGSPESARAMAMAAELAARHGGHLKAMSVVAWPPYPGGAASIDEPSAVTKQRVHDQLQTVAASEQIEEEVEYGDTDTALAHFSHELDLLIVGSRGQGLLARLLNGSTSDYLARHAYCPLLVTPHDAPEGRPDIAAAGDQMPATAGDPGSRV